MNTVCLVGRITKDPEARNTQNGATFVQFCVAVDRGDKNKTTDFIDCQAWNATAKFIAQYFHRGDPMSITGKITTRTYEKDGQQRKITDVLVDKADFVPWNNSKMQNDSNEEEQLMDSDDSGNISF